MGYNMLSSNIFLTWLEPASLWGYFCNEFFVLNLTAVVLRGVGGTLFFCCLLLMLSYASLSLFQLFEKKKKEKRMHLLSGSSSHLIWLSKNVTVLIAVSAALFECCLRLSDWTNKLSLPYVNKCRFFSFLFVIGNLNVQLFLFLFLSFSLTVLGAGPSLLQRWYLLISLHVWEMKSSGRLASTLWAIIKLRFVAQSILGVSVLWPNFLIASA